MNPGFPRSLLSSLSPIKSTDVYVNENRFLSEDASGDEDDGRSDIHGYVESRMNLSIHQVQTHYSTENTLRYLFYHMRCGIIVSIRHNELVLFCPFVNKDYTNTWHEQLRIRNGTVDDYFSEKRKYYNEENPLEKSHWWANGNIICPVPSPNYWGDHFLLHLKDMFADLCENREVCEETNEYTVLL